jgi:glyoxylase-like metal-dependent hydrolase (beta-lactamase superfamily II)
VVIIESQGEKAIYFSDVASMPIYLERLAWVPAYDLDPMQSIETKRNLARWAAHERALCLFEHDPVHAMGYLREEEEGRFRFEPV